MCCGSGSDGRRTGTVELIGGLEVLATLVCGDIRFISTFRFDGPRPIRPISLAFGIYDLPSTNFFLISRTLTYNLGIRARFTWYLKVDT